MSELLLCRETIAAVPYYIEEAGLNVYSLEELSYYIYDNTYLVSGALMNKGLIRWIREDLKATRLADALDKLLTASCPLHMFVGHILKYNGYLSDAEIKKVTDTISSFENKTDAEYRKMRADRLLMKGRITDAIYLYNSILAPELLVTVNAKLESEVLHNLGTAYSRLFFFREAADCYERAYLGSRDRDCLNQMLYALFCAGDTDTFNEKVKKYQVAEDIAQGIKNTVTSAGRSDRIKERNTELKSLKNQFSSTEAYEAELRRRVDELKAEYIKL